MSLNTAINIVLYNLFLPSLMLYLCVIQTTFSAEIDSVTTRKIKLENSLSSINQIINRRIEEGVANANRPENNIDYINDPDEDEADFSGQTDTYLPCNEDVLYTELRKAIFQSLTASLGLKGYDLDLQLRALLKKQSYHLSLNDSIYRDIDFIEGFSLRLKELSDIVNINGHLIGIDKLGHFFAEGWQYFEISNTADSNLADAIEWGRQQEAGKFGYSTTGVFSFADLTANINGWRFWNKILLKSEDPLKGRIGNFFNRPYVSCNIQIIESIKSRQLVKAWEANTRFDLTDYIDGAWDEGNNCNSYDDPVIEKKVSTRMQQVDPDFHCPIRPEACREAREKYGNFSRYVLHPACLTATEN